MPIQLNTSAINVRNPQTGEYVPLNSLTTLTRDMVEEIANEKADSIVERISDNLELEENRLIGNIQTAGNEKKEEIEEIKPYMVVKWLSYSGGSYKKYVEGITDYMKVTNCIISNIEALKEDLVIETKTERDGWGSIIITGELIDNADPIDITLFLSDIKEEKQAIDYIP